MKRWGDMLAWVFFGFAVLSLAAWPLMVWWHVTTGTPAVPAMLETLPYPLGAIFFWIVARGLKLSDHRAQGERRLDQGAERSRGQGAAGEARPR